MRKSVLNGPTSYRMIIKAREIQNEAETPGVSASYLKDVI